MTPIRIARRLTVLVPISWCLSSRAMRRTSPDRRRPVRQTSSLHPNLAYDPSPQTSTDHADAAADPRALPSPAAGPLSVFGNMPAPRPASMPVRQYTNDIPSIHPPRPASLGRDRSRASGRSPRPRAIALPINRTYFRRRDRAGRPSRRLPYRLTEHTRRRRPAPAVPINRTYFPDAAPRPIGGFPGSVARPTIAI